MTNTAMLLSIVFAATADVATTDSIKDAWEAREKELPTANIAWSVVRDSRTATFGFTDSPHPSSWHIGISDVRWRVDGERSTVQGKDDHPHPTNADPAQARLEFRQILLEQRLAGRQFIPQREPLSVVMTKSIAATAREFGDLEKALSEAAIFGTRPLLLVHAERLTVTGRNVRFFGERYSVVEERAPGNALRELWVDIKHGCRIVRITERQNGLIVSQSDLTYGVHSDRVPNGWTVMRFDEEGNVVEFAVADKVVFQAKASLAADALAAPGSVTDILAKPIASNGRTRRAFRAALDSNWLSVAVITTITILGQARWKRVQSLSLEARPVFVKTVLIALLAVGGIAVFRSTPLFDPPLSESQGRVSKIWMDVQDLRRCGVSTSDWDAFAKKSLPALNEISHELDECLSRQGPWSLMMGHDRPTELARLDLIGIARHDLPAIIRAGTSGNDVRDHSVTLRLDRVEDHLAGLSSYVLMPRAKAEIPRSLVSINGILLCCDVAAGVILIAFICLRRMRRRRLRIDSVYAMSSR